MLTVGIEVVGVVGLVAIITGAAVALTGDDCHTIALSRISLLPLCLFALGMVGWVLSPISRSDIGILPRTCVPFVAFLSALSISGLLSPVACGVVLLFQKERRKIGLKLIGIIGLAVLLLVCAAVVRMMRTGVL